jgi:hypothetical protein
VAVVGESAFVQHFEAGSWKKVAHCQPYPILGNCFNTDPISYSTAESACFCWTLVLRKVVFHFMIEQITYKINEFT